jgi:DNA primase
VLAAGEGIETMLSLRCVLPTLPMAAALSANHLAALLLPPTLRRLYVARDNDAAGEVAATALTERADAAGVETIVWISRRGDFNEDLRAFGLDALRAALRVQLVPQDVARFMLLMSAETG